MSHQAKSSNVVHSKETYTETLEKHKTLTMKWDGCMAKWQNITRQNHINLRQKNLIKNGNNSDAVITSFIPPNICIRKCYYQNKVTQWWLIIPAILTNRTINSNIKTFNNKNNDITT
jgi:hypothetical protein